MVDCLTIVGPASASPIGIEVDVYGFGKTDWCLEQRRGAWEHSDNVTSRACSRTHTEASSF